MDINKAPITDSKEVYMSDKEFRRILFKKFSELEEHVDN